MICRNVTGMHRLPLLIIRKSTNQWCFKGIKKLPVPYKNHKNSWMDTSIFIEWYETVFIPEVKNHQLGILQIHPSTLSLERENGNFKCFFPPNVISVLQPMDQGVNGSLKHYYRKALLCMVLIRSEYKKRKKKKQFNNYTNKLT
ncbi:hypothetical protein PR048_028902 [Dryococelus australis]|uniref:DDE-1 domain-containing protein n=1 Tax=Dryococelus australis TaxID=614101 RepID=A0ABQ9GEL5_9NEOP|nr:hypothetical protein PR048_028902 [Dryococelus australis]